MTVFLTTYANWLEDTVAIPVFGRTSSGRPQTEFNEASERTKRLKICIPNFITIPIYKRKREFLKGTLHQNFLVNRTVPFSISS